MPYCSRNKGVRVSRWTSRQGFSLVEVLMIMTFLSVTMVGFMMMMSQASQSSKGTYVQSSRSMLLNELLTEMSPDRPTFATLFTDGSMNTATSESGQTLPYMRKVDIMNAGATTAMKRTTHFYLYNNATDATSAPRYKTTIVQSANAIRMRIGSTSGFIDTLGNYWYGDGNLYSNANKIGGPVAAYTITTSGLGHDILNTNDDALFQHKRVAPTMDYSFDVENGAYLVKLYFAETYNSINSTTFRRLMNISLEGSQVNSSPYSPYELTGGRDWADIQSYDVTVSDGTLNITLQQDATSDDQCFLNGIEIQKRNGL
jgi:Tfp pilus assembly protein PilV